MPDAKVRPRPPSSSPSVSSSAVQASLPKRPYPRSPPATYVELKTGDSPTGALGTRSGRPAWTTTVDGSRSGVIGEIVADRVGGRGQGDAVVAQQTHRLARQCLGVGGVRGLHPVSNDGLDDVHRDARGQGGDELRVLRVAGAQPAYQLVGQVVAEPPDQLVEMGAHRRRLRGEVEHRPHAVRVGLKLLEDPLDDRTQAF